MTVYECEDCGMENEEAAMASDATGHRVCPDCGSVNVHETEPEEQER